MKKLIFFSLLFLFITGCEKRENKVEVITLSNGEYLAAAQIDQPEKVLTLSTSKDVYDKIDSVLKEQKFSENDSDNYNFKLLVNESGKLDKIIILNAPDENIAKKITEILSEHKFNIAYKDNKPVKYQFSWSLSTGYKTMADIMPQIIGGIEAVSKNLHYPEIAKRAGVEGRVLISAVINENGDVTRVKVVKGIGSGCDEAAAEAIKKLKFTPAMDKGVPVKVMISIPIMFKLSKSSI